MAGQQQVQPDSEEMAKGFNLVVQNAARMRNIPPFDIAQALQGMRDLREEMRQGFERVDNRLDAIWDRLDIM